jgi:hypothetical protein
MILPDHNIQSTNMSNTISSQRLNFGKCLFLLKLIDLSDYFLLVDTKHERFTP